MAKKILFVLTSAKEMPWGKDSGYWVEEVATPYYFFTEKGFEVELASISGGSPPVDEGSMKEPFATEEATRFASDADVTAKMTATKAIADCVESAEAGEYACVFLPGGHGAAVDLHPSVDLKKVLEACYAKGGVISAVCHGCAGLLTPLDTTTGELIIKGKNCTGIHCEWS